MTYASYSRATDPGEYVSLLNELPSDVDGICTVAKEQTIHHNLLGFFDIPQDSVRSMKRVWPPRMPVILQTIQETGPGSLSLEREPQDRVIGACISESHFLTGLLRAKGYPARIRVGYFKNVHTDRRHLVGFWRKALRTRGVMGQLYESDPQEWKNVVEDFTNKQFDIDHRIEHWVCEYWNEEAERWDILDANSTFLKAHSNIEQGFRLSRQYFEFAFEAWKYMRSADTFNPDQYAEDPQEGRSHIRSQLLFDFYSLLNHDISGYMKVPGNENDSGEEEAAFEFIKGRSFEDLSEEELKELDMLAELLSQNPPVDELVAFYRKSKTLHLENAESDPYCFLYAGG